MNDIPAEQRPAKMASRARQQRRQIAKLVASNYDISNTCNLTCEGCLYFARTAAMPKGDGEDANWEALFRSEAARGVNFAYLAGAEPSLTPNRIRSAWKHIKGGVVFTNGTRKIPADVGFRIHVSLWGMDDTSAELRGANVNQKAYRNYAGDPRAVFVFTINALNIHEIVPVAQACASHGLKLTYSYYSPTDAYQNHVVGTGPSTDTEYLRISSAAHDLRHTDATFRAARSEIDKAMATYPETVRYSMHYNDWVTQPITALWDMDDTGVAINCGNRQTDSRRHFGPDATQDDGKCCSPNLDCSECRAYAVALGTYLLRGHDFVRDPDAHRQWLETVQIWSELFMPLEEGAFAPMTSDRTALPA